MQETTENNIISLYKSGIGSYTISKQLGISKKSVLTVLKKNNIPRNNKYSKLDGNKIIDLYKSGKSTGQIAKIFSVDPEAIRYHIPKEIMRTPGESMSLIHQQADKIIKMYNSGMSSYDIADTLNITNPDCISRYLSKRHLIRNKTQIKELVAQKLSNSAYFKSRIQKKFEDILIELGIKYDPEFAIKGWNFDIKVDNILFEIQGNYWHKFKDRIARDIKKRKLALDNGYIVVPLWEHQFNDLKSIKNIILYRLNKVRPINIDINTISIIDDYYYAKELMLYHYLKKIGRSKYNYVFMDGQTPIAACVFSSVVRKEVADKQKVKYHEILELSRLVINPLYQTKNLASQLISKAVKRLRKDNKDIKLLIAFSDLTYGHTGAVYKASNWQKDGETLSDYWYTTPNRCIWHKKTVWNKAIKNNLTENAFAKLNKLEKVFGMPKIRYIYPIYHKQV